MIVYLLQLPHSRGHEVPLCSIVAAASSDHVCAALHHDYSRQELLPSTPLIWPPKIAEQLLKLLHSIVMGHQGMCIWKAEEREMVFKNLLAKHGSYD